MINYYSEAMKKHQAMSAREWEERLEKFVAGTFQFG